MTRGHENGLGWLLWLFLKVIEEMVKDFFKVLTCGKPSSAKKLVVLLVSHGNNATLEALDKMNGWI